MKARRNMTQAGSPSIGPGSGSPKIETKINKSVPKNKSVACLLRASAIWVSPKNKLWWGHSFILKWNVSLIF